jgi:hypothetical protein
VKRPCDWAVVAALFDHRWVVLRRRYAMVGEPWTSAAYHYHTGAATHEEWRKVVLGRDPTCVIEYRCCESCGEVERRDRCETASEYRTRLARIDTGETIGDEVEG